MHTIDQHRRPIGVTILAALYGLCGAFLILAPMSDLVLGQTIPAWGVLAASLATEAFILAVLVSFMFAWGLWTLNPHVYTGLLILAAVVMISFSTEMLNGTKLGVGAFTFALAQSLYLSDSGVSAEFHGR